MFAVKKDIENWCRDFLKKNKKGEYLCPFDNEPVRAVRKGNSWKIDGQDENWLWRVEDLKSKNYPCAGCRKPIPFNNGFCGMCEVEYMAVNSMIDVNKIVQITFENHGQDFLKWTVENGVVVNSLPAQAAFWNGCKILKAEAGERLYIERKGVKMEVKHPVESIDCLAGDVYESKQIH